ncbi:MAG: hypothetical protein B6244_04495 [Candidatus Cloacimonetes bacterium 4572_55]|nr:MAG: hypothetical protein B6244_04495 [Candidatus Cloacimonetes bacterium 4572_55]
MGGISKKMECLFGIQLNPPNLNLTNGRITMSYVESGSKKMDLTSAGRGFHQVLLLFAYIYANKSTILLLDEPDAHLEVLRQKEIYRSLIKAIREKKSQLIAATHSEVLLNEAAQKDCVIAFLGTPHRVNTPSQLVKSLITIGFDQYLLAEQRKWVLYLEGSTDLSMLQAFADVLEHRSKDALKSPFVKYVGNNPNHARDHFYGLREYAPKLQGIALFDNLDKQLNEKGKLYEMMWSRREIENYLPIPETLIRYVEKQEKEMPLFVTHSLKIIDDLIPDYIPGAALKDKNDEWWQTMKMSDVLNRLFRKYFEEFKKPIMMDKGRYYEIARLAKPGELDPEIEKKLEAIAQIAESVETTS